MKAVVQRVSKSSVEINKKTAGRIGTGLCILLGVGLGDAEKEVEILADKIANLRIFEDENGKMNRSVLDVGGEMLLVSQFTLLADCKKGRRPSFIHAAAPDMAEPLYEHMKGALLKRGVKNVQTGVFGADMKVNIQNEGPVTIILDTKEL